MQLVVLDKKVEKIINNSNNLIKKVGFELAIKIKQRLNELSSYSNFYLYLKQGIGKPHHLSGNLEKFYGINLSKNYRLLVEPLVDNFDIETLKICQKINIKGVVDYHGGKCNFIIP